MLVVALAVSVGLLVFCLVASWLRASGWLLFGGLLAALLGPSCVMLALPAVAVQAVIGLLALPLLTWPKNGQRAYCVASAIGFVAGWGLVAVNAVVAEQEYARLRTVYPFESLVGRITPRPPGIPPAFVPDALAEVEDEYEQRATFSDRYFGRSDLLRRLHDRQVDAFTDAAGFGVGRIIRVRPTESRLGDVEPPDPSPASSLDRMVQQDALDFADPARWGYRRGDVVAGFLPHALRRQPGPAKGWAVDRVELVGLLLAPNPRVYVSASLPRMDEVGQVETRHPDGFESPALARLRSGEELVHDGLAGRLLGAVRAAKQCLACHGGDRGDLLGAFSYHLWPR